MNLYGIIYLNYEYSCEIEVIMTKIETESKINSIISAMSDEEKVGQLFLAHCPTGEAAVEKIKQYHLGGFVMFARDFETFSPDEVKEMIGKYQETSKIPLIISADEEGGNVLRVSKFPQFGEEPFKSPRDLFRCGGWEGVREETYRKCKLLLSIGVNMNLAPVCDYTPDESAYISHRVFGVSPEDTAKFVQIVTSVMKEQGLGSSLKHFPGYGGNSDTHKGMSYDGRELSVFESQDILPFIAGINAGADSVMVSHNIVACCDKDYPSSLSYPVHEYLRNKLGYDGVIVTDSLTMSAIREFTEGKDPCVRALLCGNDMIITSKYEDGYKCVLEAVKDGTVSQDVLDSAVRRILKMKIDLHLIK